MIFVIRNSY